MSFLATIHSLREMFNEKLQEFQDEVENVHMVWLQEIQQEAVRMFSSDFSAEPELMPKTPSQKKSNRRKRVSLSRGDNRSKRRFSRGTRSNLRRSSVQTLVLIAEEAGVPDLDAQSGTDPEQPKRSTRRNKQQEIDAEAQAAKRITRKGARIEVGQPETRTQPDTQPEAPPDKEPAEESQKPEKKEICASTVPSQDPSGVSPQRLEAVVLVSASERRSAELQLEELNAAGRLATKIAIAGTQETSSHCSSLRRSSMRRSSVRCSFSRRRSLSGLRHSMTQESIRRASRRSFLKKKAKRSSSANSSANEEVIVEADGEETGEQVERVLPEDGVQAVSEAPEPEMVVMVEEEGVMAGDENVCRVTRSMAQTTSTQPAASNAERPHTSTSDDSEEKPAASLRVNPSTKRLASEDIGTPKKKPSPPKKQPSIIKPNMKSFLHTVQKNQVLMSTPGSLGRNAIVKSFIKHTTPLRVDTKPSIGLVERERLRLENLKKKEEQEIERKKKMEEDKKRKQEEMKRKRDERLRKVVEARVKEEQKEEEKKRKIEMKFAQMEEKNDKMRVERLAEEKAKKKVASKRQEELELRRKQEEEARRKKIQQAEEEKRQQELQAKRRAEEEQERARKLAEARRAQEYERELEKEREKERLRQQQAAAERERLEREKAAALQRELEKAAREKERREAEERRLKAEQERLEKQKAEQERLERLKAEQEKAALQKRAAEALLAAKNTAELQESVLKTPGGKAAGLNVTVDVEKSPQSYEITPKGRSKPVVVVNNPDDYGMDQNSDDSTDDESAPRKPIPSWAEGRQLQQAMLQQYFNPVDVDSYFGEIEAPKLERIFRKSKPRYFKRTSSAVWQSPPRTDTTAF